MDNWFTIEQIDRDTFSISEYKHWEETHCYLLCGEKYAILIDTGLGVSRYPTKNFTRWRFSKFRRAGNSSCSHAGTFSRTLLLLRTRTKLFVFRGFDIQGKPGRILPNYRPEAILSIYKANTEIQYKKSSARTPSVGYSRFFDSRY